MSFAGFDNLRQETKQQVEMALQPKLQAEHEHEYALAARKDFECDVVPLFRALKESSIRRKGQFGTALVELGLISSSVS